MSRVHANDVDLELESFGRSDDPLVLLIMGLGAQLVAWPTAFCEELAALGFCVVRFDNRDAGKSTHLIEAGIPDMAAISAAVAAGKQPDLPYHLDDMALDVIGILDALGRADAHLVGVSLGGMIAQIVAIDAPQRVRSLVSIMSTSGAPGLPQARPDALAAVTAPPPSPARQDLVDTKIRARRIIESPAYRAGADELKARVTEEIDRIPYEPTGTARQYAAILAAKPRAERLATITCPTLVLHGEDDPLIPLEAGKDVAKRIPGAELVTIPGMAHDLTDALTPVFLDHIGGFLRRAENR